MILIYLIGLSGGLSSNKKYAITTPPLLITNLLIHGTRVMLGQAASLGNQHIWRGDN